MDEPMRTWHQLMWGIEIHENGGLFYVLVWVRGHSEPDYGCWYHDWMFMNREQVFEYVDWCDVYCDVTIIQLLYK